MRDFARLAGVLLSAAALWGCSNTRTVTVSVPPRVDLLSYGTLGLVDFASNASPSINTQTTRQFGQQIHSAQPGTRILDLGSREALLATVGSRQLDAIALRKIGERYGVSAIFVGDLKYSEPKTEVKVTDIAKLEGSARVELRGDISFQLIETRSGASVWSSSAWARRPVGQIQVSADGITGAGRGSSNPREEMVPSLVYHVTEDFRPSSMRQRQ
jgi:hypothetical protein